MLGVKMLHLVIVVLIFFSDFVNSTAVQLDREIRNPAFDPEFYHQFLNSELCARQLMYIREENNSLLWIQFLEAGLRIPRSILTGNLLDLGNYHQCLGINQRLDTDSIEGKYCFINVPANQNLSIPIELDVDRVQNSFEPKNLKIDEDVEERLKLHNAVKSGLVATSGVFDKITRSSIEGIADDILFTLAICVPKSCTIREGLSGLYYDVDSLGLDYNEGSCRLNNDKPCVPADYVAISIFSALGLITLASTCFELYSIFVLKKDPKSILTTIARSFSVYTNTRRLITFLPSPGALECIDGIRAIAMMWIIFGHTALTLPPIMNTLEGLDWQLSFRSIWITGAPITVDTFFLISGLLVVYTTAGKLTGMKLLKNLHLFYLNRILRMFPLLAATILLQVSILHRIADGPLWDLVAVQTNNCRLNWWINLLYLQNYVSTRTMCLGPTWYLAIDMHLHLISPIILFWALSKNRRTGWIAVTAGLLISLAVTTTYNFIKKFPGSSMAPARQEDSLYYSTYYYINTLPRASTFFVGMLFGYYLHSTRSKKLRLSKITTISLWICTFALSFASFCATEPMKSADWDNQTIDSLVNSFMRPIWVTSVGLLIVLCVKGYGGPINWFLSLGLWKLPSRISFAMYLTHYSLMFVVSGTFTAPIHFSLMTVVLIFFSHYVLVFITSFFMTLLIDSPFSTIFKLLLSGQQKQKKATKDDTQTGITNNAISSNEADKSNIS